MCISFCNQNHLCEEGFKEIEISLELTELTVVSQMCQILRLYETSNHMKKETSNQTEKMNEMKKRDM